MRVAIPDVYSPWWASPDISIIRPNVIRGTEAFVGEEEEVKVTVTNARGITARAAFVDAFVADPTTVITPATATIVGGGYLTIPGDNRQEAIRFTWIPTS
jgi:hypothetical protein